MIKKSLFWALALFLLVSPAVSQTSKPEATGHPTLMMHRYEKIIIQYGYAPGLAMSLGGKALLYSQMDPWASSFGGSNLGRGSNFGGNLGGSLGSGLGSNSLGGGLGSGGIGNSGW